MFFRLSARRRPRSGQTIVEYGLLLFLIAILAFGAIQLVGANVNTSFSSVDSSIDGAGSGGGGGGGGNPADFTFTPTEPAPGADVEFDGPDTATDWDWDFGDGSPHDTTEDPTHSYSAPNTYTVTLTTNEGTHSVAIDVVDGITDTFDRTLASGWGTASSGLGWSGGSVDAYLSVDGDWGLMRALDDTETVNIGGVPAEWDDTIAFEFTFAEIPDTLNSGDYYEWEFGCGPDFKVDQQFYPDGVGGIDYYDFLVQGENNTGDDEAFPYVAGDTYHVKGEIEGTQMRAKIWADGDTEPATWNVEDNGDPNESRFEEITECHFTDYGFNDWGSNYSTLWVNDLDINVTEVVITP